MNRNDESNAKFDQLLATLIKNKRENRNAQNQDMAEKYKLYCFLDGY